jgi:hypothetical protein
MAQFTQVSLSMKVMIIHINSLIEKTPMLFIDVNLGKDKGMKRLIIYQEDDPIVIAQRFGENYDLNENKILKLETMLQFKIMEYKRK